MKKKSSTAKPPTTVDLKTHWTMVSEWQTARSFAGLNQQHVDRLRIAIEHRKLGDEVELAKEHAVEAMHRTLNFGELALSKRWAIVDAVAEMAETLGTSAPRSLREFGVLLRPHWNEEKAIELWPTVQIDLETIEPATDTKRPTMKHT